MFSIDPRLASAVGMRPSSIERLADLLGLNRFFLRRGNPSTVMTDPHVVVSPAQCRVAWAGSVREGRVCPGKRVFGKRPLWELKRILWDDSLSPLFSGGLVFNLYLAPTDLHYLVSPVSARVESVRHFPGRFWPIVFLKRGEVENERVLVLFQLDHGRRAAMVLVGSFLVRGIVFLPRPGDRVEKGDLIGGFKIGSTVFLILEANYAIPQACARERLLPGEPIARLMS